MGKSQLGEILFTLRAVKNQVNRLAKQINASKNVLPTFGTSKHDGTPHIEIDGEKYRYVVYDRGSIVRSWQTLDIQELLYWIFQDVTSQMGNSYELAHRNPNVDSRKLAFHHRLELLEKLNLEWKEKEQQKIKEILRSHPYSDETH